MPRPVMTRNAAPDDMEFVDCIHYLFEWQWVGGPHRHEGAHEMVLVVRGQVRTAVGGRALSGRAGDVMIYPGDLDHAPAAVGGERLETISLLFCGGERLGRLAGPEVRFDRNERLRHQLEWVLDLHPSSGPADRRAVAALAQTALHELGRLANPAAGDLPGRIRRYIRRNLTGRIALDDLAAEAGLSRFHFARTFREATGTTPMRLVSQMRVDAAGDLLRRTDLPLEAIAARVGLADASHLSHLFRRLTGRPPGAVRRGGRGKKSR